MSLDVYLNINEDEQVYRRNITHNLNKMADAAGIYMHLWRPEEINITKASELIEPLSKGLCLLVCNKAHFEKFNPSNGWGTWESLVDFVTDYLAACKEHPSSTIRICR